MNEIIIDLANSSNARVFKGENIIHQEALKKVKDFLEEFRIKETTDRNTDNKLTYKHNTITILGTRGSGKTSFLLSIEDLINNPEEKYSDLLFLEMIDPTLVEEKGHVFLNVISVICDKVSESLERKQANSHIDIHCIKKSWKESMNKLAKGLPSIDGIGGNKFGEWQDAEFVMQNELQSINSARKLAQYFSDFIKLSLSVLEKKQFVLFFDDIDVDSSKGYAVLETIRKYFISDQIVTFLSGDLKLYDALVREKKWSNFGTHLINYETSKNYQEEGRRRINSAHYNDMVTDLTSQYLIKIMQPKYRIHLSTLYEHYKRNEENILVKRFDEDSPIKLKSFLRFLFLKYGIKSNLQRVTFIEFLLKQPLRTVVHFLQYHNKKDNNGTDFISVFLSDLYEKHVDVNVLQESTTYFLATVLRTLIQEKKLNESYQLIPSTLDNSMNATLFTSGLLLSHHINNNNKFLIFEYFLKIAYLRNFSEQEENDRRLMPIINISGILNDSVLRDSINRLQCGLYSYFHNLKHTEFGMLPLYGFAKNAKKDTEQLIDRIDSVLEAEDVNPIRKMIGYIPCFIGQSNTKQSTSVFYSLVSLLATIGEMCKRYESGIIKNENLISELLELSQLRYYSINEENRYETETYKKKSEDEYENEGSEHTNELEINDSDFFLLNTYLENWFNLHLDTISPYLMGKIFTRFYFSLKGISLNNLNLGEVFNLQIISFFNSVIIEEARELNLNIHLNNNNIITSSTNFINNLNKVSESKFFFEMTLTQWFLSCPILVLYTDETVFNYLKNLNLDNFLQFDYYNKFEVNSLLEDVALLGFNTGTFNKGLDKKLNTRSFRQPTRISKKARNKIAFESIKEELVEKRNIVLNIFPSGENFTQDRVNKFFEEFDYILDVFQINDRKDRNSFAKRCVDYLKYN